MFACAKFRSAIPATNRKDTMSLEQALAENTATLKQLIAVMQSNNLELISVVKADLGEGADGTTATSGETTAKGTRKPRAAKTDTVAVDQTTQPGYLRQGDAPGTRYWHIEKHNTVYLEAPGAQPCSISGAVIVSGAEFDRLKADYAARFPTSAAAATAPAATPSAGPASTASPAASPALDGPTIMAKCKELHAKLGNDGLKEILDKFKVTRVPELVAMTASFGDIAAAIDAKMTPAFDPFA